MLQHYEHFSRFGWDSNPFTLTVTPELMVGYSEQSKTLLSHVQNFHKFALVLGPTGAGKTTLLLWLRAQLMALKDFLPIYVAKPPKKIDDLIFLFKSILRFNLLDKIRFRNMKIFDLHKFIPSKLRGRRFILLIDEAHESSIEVLEWLRTLTDSVPNMSIIFAALPVFENDISTRLPTLFMRFNTKVYLNSLNRSETEALIAKRIESVGGEGIKPFTEDAVDKIFEITGGFPREIIKVCDFLIKEAASRNMVVVNKKFIESVYTTPTQSEVVFKLSLPKKQRQIIELLNETPNLTPSEIVEHLKFSNYKNKSNAIRSVNNILRRLMKEELVQRKKLKNSYVYSLTGKAKTILAKA